MEPQAAVVEAVRCIQAQPRSGQSLLLYGLLKTLTAERGAHTYLLSKLREMEPQTRQIAYGLMEAMAAGSLSPQQWLDAAQQADQAFSGG